MGDGQGTNKKYAMSYRLTIRSEAQRDLAKKALWYGRQEDGDNDYYNIEALNGRANPCHNPMHDTMNGIVFHSFIPLLPNSDLRRSP